MQEIKNENFPFSLEELREQQQRLSDRITRHTPTTEAEIEYAKRIFAESKPADILSAIKLEVSSLKKDRLPIFQISDTYETAKFYVWEAYKSVLQVERGITKPHVNENTKLILQELTKWFFCIPGGSIPLDKGVYLFGNYGCGKTMIMKTFRLVLNKINEFHPVPHRAFKIVYCKNIIEQYRENPKFNMSEFQKGVWCMDDIGYGAQEVKKWGNSINPVEEILHANHKRLLDVGAVTIATSNLSLEDCQHLFDARVADRMYEMFFPVKMDGKSFR